MLTRREFLATSMCTGTMQTSGQHLWAHAEEVPVTGVAHPQLAPFDTLLKRFLTENNIPGASVAVTFQGRLVYARGFGYADRDTKKPVPPFALFRLASISKPITAVAVLHLAERGKLKLDDPVLKHIRLPAHAHPNVNRDPRWQLVTIDHCLHHTAGWDRDRKGGFDPAFIPERIHRAMHLPGAPSPDDIVSYMMGLPLDFEPGARMCYSNLGYLVLGRVIEAVTGARYETWVKKEILGPIHAEGFSLGKGLPEARPHREVKYYDAARKKGVCLYPPRMGEQVALPDGGENVEGFEAHGGWISSASDLVRFAAVFDYGKKSPLLSGGAIKELWARPPGLAGFTPLNKPRDVYYGCGWQVRPIPRTEKANAWHNGLISGSSTLLVRRFDGLNWAVLFNTDANSRGEHPADLIDGPMHEAADAVKRWPAVDLFEKS